MKESYFNNFLKYLQKKQYLSLLYYFQKHVTCLFTSLQPLHYKKKIYFMKKFGDLSFWQSMTGNWEQRRELIITQLWESINEWPREHIQHI